MTDVKSKEITAALQALFRSIDADAQLLSWSISSLPVPGSGFDVTINVTVTGGCFTPEFRTITWRDM